MPSNKKDSMDAKSNTPERETFDSTQYETEKARLLKTEKQRREDFYKNITPFRKPQALALSILQEKLLLIAPKDNAAATNIDDEAIITKDSSDLSAPLLASSSIAEQRRIEACGAYERIQDILRKNNNNIQLQNASQWMILARATVEEKNNITENTKRELQRDIAILAGLGLASEHLIADNYLSLLYLIGVSDTSYTAKQRMWASVLNFARLVAYKGLDFPTFWLAEASLTMQIITQTLLGFTITGAVAYGIRLFQDMIIILEHYLDKDNQDSLYSIITKDNRHHRMWNNLVWAGILTASTLKAFQVITYTAQGAFFPMLIAAGYWMDLLQCLWKSNNELNELYAIQAKIMTKNADTSAIDNRILNREADLSSEAMLYFGAFAGVAIATIPGMLVIWAMPIIIGIAAGAFGIALLGMAWTHRRQIAKEFNAAPYTTAAKAFYLLSVTAFAMTCLFVPILPLAIALVGISITAISQALFCYKRYKAIKAAEPHRVTELADLTKTTPAITSPLQENGLFHESKNAQGDETKDAKTVQNNTRNTLPPHRRGSSDQVDDSNNCHQTETNSTSNENHPGLKT